MLVSGVYFHGAWERSFTFQSNETEYFYLNNTHGTTVRMMSQYGRFKYVNLPEMRSEAVSIPFAVSAFLGYQSTDLLKLSFFSRGRG